MIEVASTARLSFRLLGAEDKELLFELDQDPEVMKYINGGKMTTMKDVEEVYLPRLASYSSPEKGWGMWGVFVKNNEDFIGWILVRPMEFFSENPEFDNLELGWRFKRSSWGNGYGTEAAKAVMDAVGEPDDVKRLSAVAMLGNEASVNIMKKLGMEYIKTYTHKDPLGDIEAVYYSLEC
ncbi:GNAT family N-acetyltransferase [Aliikangiella sp. G2MR2-5]|uniref:GNAT family N-acetyltransferase n=1 Tax=Aliikangiella sp. G2MR2-5 TaxID=2788943 RepID=UPI0018ABC341|nr:GNAT family N-acetyltransferase [Aliikangiella sp. G2MR2-5]